MRFFAFSYFTIALFFSTTTFGSTKFQMELKVTKRQILKDVPSASGIEVLGESIYAIGDNSPWLFKLNSSYNCVDKFQIFSPLDTQNALILKSHKPDFEAITLVKNNGVNEFYIFGSGSKSPTRDVLIIIDVNHPKNWKQYSLAKFYDQLKKQASLTDNKLNIEAALVHQDYIYLFNRGKNAIIKVSIAEFNSFIEEEIEEIKLAITNIQLPKINEIESRFSGACYLPEIDKIIFTSTVEDTPNWIDDGQVLGSFVGIIDITNLEKTAEPMYSPIMENGKILPLKIEAVTILSFKKNKINLLIASDGDGAESEILEATLILNDE